MHNTVPEISVCICTFKRPSALQSLLESLSRQSLHPQLFEIIIVDNDENGSAAGVVKVFKKSHIDRSIVYAIECQRGISYARNKTVKLSRGKLLAFIDDDEVAHPHWLSNLLMQIELDQSDAVFGPVLPKYPENTPSWIIQSNFFERPRFQSGAILKWNDTRTGNALIKAKWARRRYPSPFKSELALTGGEDTDFFRWISCNNGFFTWCDTAEVSELVDGCRLQISYMLKRSFRQSALYWHYKYSEMHLIFKCLAVLSGFFYGIACLFVGFLMLPLGLALSARFSVNAFSAFGRVGALSGKITKRVAY